MKRIILIISFLFIANGYAGKFHHGSLHCDLKDGATVAAGGGSSFNRTLDDLQMQKVKLIPNTKGIVKLYCTFAVGDNTDFAVAWLVNTKHAKCGGSKYSSCTWNEIWVSRSLTFGGDNKDGVVVEFEGRKVNPPNL